jgi:hypothetical protein
VFLIKVSNFIPNKLIATLFVCTFLASTALQGADLHVVLVGDTTDLSLGTAFQNDLDLLQEETKKIAAATGMGLNVSLFSGKQVTTEKVVNAVMGLDVQPEDAVIIYFTMHGYRFDSKKSPWPNLFFGVEQRGIDFGYLNEIVKEKNPRFLLSIADCCNNVAPEGSIPTIGRQDMFFSGLNKASKSNYRKLFLETSGSIIISSAVPGEYSWAYTKLGAVYSLKFLESLEEAVRNSKSADWQTILDNTSLKVTKALIPAGESQTAQYELSIAL